MVIVQAPAAHHLHHHRPHPLMMKTRGKTVNGLSVQSANSGVCQTLGEEIEKAKVMGTRKSRWRRWLAWANFGLLAAAALKFIPIGISLTHGATLNADQIANGLADERAWALDLISDTPYLLLVWMLVALLLRRQTGDAMIRPWRSGV